MTYTDKNSGKPAICDKAKDYNRYWQERSRYRPLGNYTPVPENYNLSDQSFQFQEDYKKWPWANDPCNVLFNEKDGLYYSWIMSRPESKEGRADPAFTDWVEMVSEDCVNWRQTEIRLQRGVHITLPLGFGGKTCFAGGSAWIDKTNRFGYGEGAVLFLVSLLLPCMIHGIMGLPQSVGLFVAPKGLGTPIEKRHSRFIFRKAAELTDWRDTRMQWDAENSQLLFAISNHNKVQIYGNKTKNIADFKLLQSFDTGYESGIECPDFRPITDSSTGEKHWLLTVCKQNPGQGLSKPEQTVFYYLGKWDGKRFMPSSSAVLEYGYDFYAPSVSEPRQDSDAKILHMRGYLGNWAYNKGLSRPQRGFNGGCWEDRELYVENGAVKIRPLLPVGGLPAQPEPPAEIKPVWVRAALAPSAEKSAYVLHWSEGDTLVLNLGTHITFDTRGSGSVVVPGKPFALLPLSATEEEKLEIFINGCCVSFYIGGKQAGFQIYPRGVFTGLHYVAGAERIQSVEYRDVTSLFL